jgi:hypothetical protein
MDFATFVRTMPEKACKGEGETPVLNRPGSCFTQEQHRYVSHFIVAG